MSMFRWERGIQVPTLRGVPDPDELHPDYLHYYFSIAPQLDSFGKKDCEDPFSLGKNTSLLVETTGSVQTLYLAANVVRIRKGRDVHPCCVIEAIMFSLPHEKAQGWWLTEADLLELCALPKFLRI